MVTPINSLSSSPARNPTQELAVTSTRVETTSEPSKVTRESGSAILPAQVVSVTTLSEEVTPTEEADLTPAQRSVGAEQVQPGRLDEAEAAMVRELAQRDREVRQHEMAHKSAAGSAAGAISYEYQRGPDGRLYAIGGEVSIRLSPPSNDPAEVQRYAEQILRAALAPAEPSGQDRQVAAQARSMIAEAQAELAQQAGETEEANAATEESREADARTEERSNTSRTEDVQGDIEAQKERAAESLAEFQQNLAEVSNRLAEVNQKLVQLGVLEELYVPPGTILKTTA